MDELFGRPELNKEIETVAAPKLAKLKKMFLHYENNCSEHREDAFRDRRYYDGEQISDAWRKNMEANDTPIVPINLIKDNLAAHIGLVAAQQTEIKAEARTAEGAQAAEVATKLLRYAIDASKLETVFQTAVEPFFIEGVGAVLIECDAEAVYPTIIDYRDFVYDPDSRRSDFSDAKWMGFSRWLDANDIEAAYPEAYAALNPTGASSDFTDLTPTNGFERDTDASPWVNDRKMVRVIEMYYLEAGQWMNVVWCHRGVLDHGPSQYLDDNGRSRCPIRPEACHTMAAPDAKNQRYGQVRGLRGPQDDYNSRRATALKYTMSKVIQQIDPSANPIDPETLRQEANKRIVIMPPGYQMADQSVSAEQVQYMEIAGAEIQRLSPAAAVTGANLPNGASGRSRQLAAAGGRLSLAPVLSRVQEWRENLYRDVWYCINQYWRAEMQVRISGDINAPKYLHINKPIVEEIEEPIVDPQTGQPVFDPITGGIATQRVAKVVGVHNEVATMDMDFKITTVEAHNSLEQEVWDSLMNMMSSLQIQFGSPEFRLALEWYPMPNKTSVIERYDAMLEKMKAQSAEGDAAQAQIAQMQQQIQMLMDKSKADKDASTADSNAAKAERTRFETAMLADGVNTQREIKQIVAQQLFRQ